MKLKNAQEAVVLQLEGSKDTTNYPHQAQQEESGIVVKPSAGEHLNPADYPPLLNAEELIKAVEHGVNRELKFNSLTEAQRSYFRQLAGEEALGRVQGDSTYNDVIKLCRRVVRRLLKELRHQPYLEVHEEMGGEEHTDGYSGQTLSASATSSAGHSRYWSWVEDLAIERIDRKAVINEWIRHFGRDKWDWLLEYLLAEKKPDDAKERVRFSRMMKSLRQLANNSAVRVLQTMP